MFTGIIEILGKIISIERDKSNVHFGIEASFVNELKVDQSVAHNGVCLTLQKTDLGTWKVGDHVNLERCMLLGGRLDGHIVQGHIDQTGTCTSIEDKRGSWVFTIEYDSSKGNVTIEKGSVTINGISLTVINSGDNNFSVAIIPYTFTHTTMQFLKPGSKVNLEFDVIGKYVARLIGKR